MAPSHLYTNLPEKMTSIEVKQTQKRNLRYTILKQHDIHVF